MKTFVALVITEYHLTKRSLANLLLGIGMPVAFFLFFSNTMTQGTPQALIREVLLSSMLSMSAFSSISFALFTFPFMLQDDRLSYRLKSLQHSPIPMWQYYLVKMMRVMLYYVLAITLVFLVGHFVRGIQLSFRQWVIAAGSLFYGATCLLGVGLLLSFIYSSERLSLVANLLYLGLAMLGGLWIPVTYFPDWVQSISRITPTYHILHFVLEGVSGHFAYSSFLILGLYAIIGLGLVGLVYSKMEKK